MIDYSVFQKIMKMFNSTDPEMRDLGATLFCASNPQIEDYNRVWRKRNKIIHPYWDTSPQLQMMTKCLKT